MYEIVLEKLESKETIMQNRNTKKKKKKTLQAVFLKKTSRLIQEGLLQLSRGSDFTFPCKSLSLVGDPRSQMPRSQKTKT